MVVGHHIVAVAGNRCEDQNLQSVISHVRNAERPVVIRFRVPDPMKEKIEAQKKRERLKFEEDERVRISREELSAPVH